LNISIACYTSSIRKYSIITIYNEGKISIEKEI